MNVQRIIDNVKRHGLINTVADLVSKGINRYMVLKILKGVKIEEVNPTYLRCNEGYEGRFLDRAALATFEGQPEFDLSAAFLDRAFAKGDECYGFMTGNTLAAYGWYSRKPTAIDVPGLVLHFSPDYVYMYKGFTHPSHRGQRLHAVGMTRALEAYLARGQKGIVSYVEKYNFDSLRSCYRMGYQDFGSLYVVGVANHYLLHASPGCQALGFMLSSPPACIADRTAIPLDQHPAVASQVRANVTYARDWQEAGDKDALVQRASDRCEVPVGAGRGVGADRGALSQPPA